MKTVLEQLAVVDSEFAITAFWANLSPPGGEHPQHVHPNNFLSGVYYVACPQGANSITFHDPRPQAVAIYPKTTRPVPELSTQMSMETKPGRMVLFPSWHRHSVPRNNSDQERLSISLNVMLTDYLEKHASPNWKGLKRDGSR